MKRPFCLLLTGMPNSGKSTIAAALKQKSLRYTIDFDGDWHRRQQFLGRKLGFTKKDIMLNAEHVIKLVNLFKLAPEEHQPDVILPMIAPYRDQRVLMRSEINNFYEVYCKCSLENRQSRPNFRDSEIIYEEGGAHLALDTAQLTVDACVNIILRRLG